MYCTVCHHVLEEDRIVNEVSFADKGSGGSGVVGKFIRRDIAAGNSEMTDGSAQTLANSRRRLAQIADGLSISENFVDAAQRLYLIALNGGFTSGHSSQVVSAACLYVLCRRSKTEHMLIDFSNALRMNMFVVGNCFLKLLRRFNLDVPIVDPSFYINRFVGALQFGEMRGRVTATALQLMPPA
ncbi:Transcription factor TFIIB repeat [Carpediemonas membranifera]|uniref:Transcription factor TFIIB repeat n=1 Tax=Carpediemonas membranifera TaxID=201153 RepID=A0A8J6AU56_9EUKA|nr:Transcription factor TFIIB repeat [Carpediemonas membranifera]|eukprot:KAG9394786.1 Transcription factor TFIIB repeat [Carpediemonas membranifera]